MNTIHKYVLSEGPVRTNIIEMPYYAEVLTAQMQEKNLCIWAMHHIKENGNPEDEIVKRKFHVFGTGWDIPDERNNHFYIATVQDDGFVWHIFEEV